MEKYNYKTITSVMFLKSLSGRRIFLWKCVCGKEFERSLTDVKIASKRNKIQSCGCLKRKMFIEIAKNNRTHGMGHTIIYHKWRQMHNRCYNKNNKDFRFYGARGIFVCKEWHDPLMFLEWSKLSGFVNGLTIDRIDVNKEYSPDNCRWVKMSEQGKNTRRCRSIMYESKKYTLTDFCKKYKLGYSTTRGRFNRGWDIEKILNTKK